MVDVNKKKGGKSKKKKKKKGSSSSKKKKKGSGSPSSGSSSDNTEPYTMTDETTANAEDASVASTSQRWSQEGSELNYDAGANGSEQQYIQRQIKECQEFYQDYLDTAKDNITDINQFTLYHHALLLSMAKNRAGICDIFMKRFGYDEQQALAKAREVCKEAGEAEAFVKLTDEVTTSIRED